MKNAKEFSKKCRQAGLKVTPQRTMVYMILSETKEHPSAERVWQKARKILPNVSFDTVNRTLLTFAEKGLAFTVEGSGDARRFDGEMENHQHFKCVKCKRILDFHYQPFDDIKVPARIMNNCEILRKSVYLEGICEFCRKQNKG
jgi:Fur family peroxide stress response transcriptional regulator